MDSQSGSNIEIVKETSYKNSGLTGQTPQFKTSAMQIQRWRSCLPQQSKHQINQPIQEIGLEVLQAI